MTRTFVAGLSGWRRFGHRPGRRVEPPAGGAGSGRPSGHVASASVPARALVDKYCLTCHNARTKSGGLVLEGIDVASPAASAETWEKVIRKVRGGMMPPVGMPHPDKAAMDAFAGYLEASIDAAAAARPNPGRTVLHRLNRAEYGNAMRDLLALDVDVASLLPADDSAYGFDNIGDVLGVSPALMERYLSAAWKISSLAVGNPKIDADGRDVPRAVRPVAGRSHRRPAHRHARRHPDPLHVPGRRRIRHPAEAVPRDGRTSSAASRSPHDLEITFDGERVTLARFGGAEDEKANYLNPTAAGDALETRFKVRLPVKAGPHFVGVAFLKKSSAPSVDLLQPFLRERIDPITPVGIPEVDKVTIEGPFNVTGTGDSPSRRRIFSCRPAARRGRSRPARRTMLTTLARRAYRRPADRRRSRSADGLLSDTGTQDRRSFDAGIENALAFMLVSPQFLFRFERDPRRSPADGVYRLSDLELASRLSFFIWSSIPDDQLLNLAVQGKLQRPGRARAAGEADARRRARPRARQQLRRPMAVPAQPARACARTRTSSRTSTTTCGRRCSAKRSCSSKASCVEDRSVLDLLTRTTPS